jgi:hypothetical protein
MTGRATPLRSLATALALWLAAPVAQAAPDCEALAEAAAARHGIPEGVMAAIARTESGGGRRSSAWPWTLNMAGDGHYLETRDEALTRLRAALDGGGRNVDVGCMQINWHWHNEAFGSLEQMIDPEANTEYAARFLLSLWRREGTWDAAVAAYHSSDPERGAAYLSRVERLRRAGVGRGAQGTGGPVAAMTGDLSEGVLVAAGPGVASDIATGHAGDRRFGAQAPLVRVPGDGATGSAGTGAGNFPAAMQAVPEGALPDLAAGVARLSVAHATRSPGAALSGDADRLARIRADFRQAVSR